jgi:glycine betaine catabolism A
MSATMNQEQPLEAEDLGTSPIPLAPFISEEYFALEREHVFKKTWRHVGRIIDDLPNPGDYFVKEFDVPKLSLIISRDHDGTVRAFHNVCRHRGARLVETPRGNGKNFICGFHGWNYSSDGRLIGISDERQFKGLEKADCGLLPIHVDTWNGFIFINFAEKPAETLREFLGKMGDVMKPFPHEKMRMTGHYEAIINCNWKSFWYAFMEAYHVPFVHKHSVKALMETTANPYTNMFDFEFLGRHNAASIPANPDAKPGELDLNVRSLADTQLIGLSNQENECTAPINKSRANNFMFRITQIFPNMALHMGSGYFYTYNMEPISVDQTRWVHKIYGYPAANAAARVANYYAKVLFRDALLEDVTTLEPMHASLKTGVLPYIVLGDQEALLRHHFMMVDEMVRAGEKEALS